MSRRTRSPTRPDNEPCNRWWETSPIIGTVTTKKLGEGYYSQKYDVVKVTYIHNSGVKAYITNISYEPGRKCEPVVIVEHIAESYKEKKR